MQDVLSCLAVYDESHCVMLLPRLTLADAGCTDSMHRNSGACSCAVMLTGVSRCPVSLVQAPRPNIHMYGFGSPRVGNIPFAEKFDELVFNAWRISNLNDIVTK